MLLRCDCSVTSQTKTSSGLSLMTCLSDSGPASISATETPPTLPCMDFSSSRRILDSFTGDIGSLANWVSATGTPFTSKTPLTVVLPTAGKAGASTTLSLDMASAAT